MKFRYVDGVTSSGKSVILRSRALYLSSHGHNVIIVLPTIDLINEYEFRFKREHANFKVEPIYTGDDRPDGIASVTISVKRVIETTLPDEGRTIIVTHQAFTSIKVVDCLSDWQVLIDEEMDVFQGIEINVHHSHSVITKHLESYPQGPKYGKVLVSNAAAIKEIYDNRNNDVAWGLMKDACKALLSPWAENYTILASYDALVMGRGNKRKLIIYSSIPPSLAQQYVSVTVFCARFTETLHYLMWQSQGVTWERDEELCSQLQIQGHAGYDKLKIYYGYEGHFSKRLRDSRPDMYEQFMVRAKEVIGGQPFIWLVNNDIQDNCKVGGVEGSARIKAKSHGLNKYDHLDHAIIASAYNKTPGAGKFLEEWFKISTAQVNTSGINQKIYQAVSRTSMRLGDPERERIWVVPDRNVAEWLSGIMIGSSVFSLNLEQPPAKARGRHAQYDDANQRKLQSKRNAVLCRKQKEAFEVEIAPEMISSMCVHSESAGDDNAIRSISNFVANYRGTIFTDRYRNRGECLFLDGQGFIRYLKKQSKIQYTNKHDVPLISPAFWNPCYNGERPRGKHNAVCSNGLMLDVDGGEMRPEDLTNLFPHLRLYAYSTFSHTKGEQRYRVYIPSTRPTAIPEYRAILEALVDAVESHGYIDRNEILAKPRVSVNTKLHGIDRSKLGAFSLFYLPCQPENGARSFFKSFEGLGKYPLDVNDWLSNLPPGIHARDSEVDRPAYYEPLTCEINAEQEAGIDRAMDRWGSCGALPGNGYQGICNLFSDLCRLKLPRSTIQWHLLNAASFASSPRDRRKQVEGLMKTWVTKRRG